MGRLISVTVGRIASQGGGAACSSVQASGAGYQRNQDLSGSTLTAKAASATSSNVISFPAGNNTFSDFAQTTDGVVNGYFNGSQGIVGVGPDLTTFSMVASTSTKAASVPTQAQGGTNQLYLMHFNKASNLTLSCFGLNGSEQGHLYNGIRMHQCENAQIKNVKLNGAAPGDWYFQPGETFGIASYGGDNHYYENVTIDGTLNGTPRGASAFGANGLSATDGIRGYTYKNCWGNNQPYSAAFALWQGAGVHTLIGCGSTGGNRTNLNLERMGREVFRGSSSAMCTVNVVNYTWGSVIAAGQDIFYGNDQGRTYLNIYDPIGRSASNKIKVYYPSTEQGNPQLAQMGDIKVYVGGTWSGGSPGVGSYIGGTNVSSTYLNFTGSGV